MKSKNVLLFLMLFVFSSIGHAFSQIRESFLFSNTVNTGQLGDATCWASTLETITKTLNKSRSNIQCSLIEKYSKSTGACCNTECKSAFYTKAVLFDTLLTVLRPSFESFSVSIDISTKGLNRTDSLYRNWYKNQDSGIELNKNLPFSKLKNSFLNNSPICLWKFWDFNYAHITSVVGFEHTQDTTTKKQLKWLYVQDPWPLRKGSKYLMTYEYYKKPILFNLDSEYVDEPQKALIYNLVSKENNILSSFSEKTTELNEANAINIVNNINRNVKKSAQKQANEILTHLNKNSSDSLLKYVGLQRNQSMIDAKSIVKVYSINNRLDYQPNIEASLISNGQPFTPEKWFDTYLTLFSDINEVLITLNDITDNKKKLAVMAIDTTQNNEWYVSRIEPFESSIMSVIEDLNIKIAEIDAIYINKATGSFNDFCIIKFKSNRKKTIYVDLMSTNDLALESFKIGNTGFFNYNASEITNKNKLKIAAYLAPSFENKNRNTFIPTDASKAFIESYNKLIKVTENTIEKLKLDSCPYSCSIFTTSSTDFTKIAASSKISFISAFNIYGDAYKNSFITPLIDDSYIVVDKMGKNHIVYEDSLEVYKKIDSVNNKSPLHYYTNTFSTNCKNFTVDSDFKFPKNGYRDSSFIQEVIFVPVVKYKTLRDKKFDATDFERFQEYAISPFEMKEIKSPFIESNTGYLATSNNRDSINYNDKKSVTGLVCEVELKSKEKIQCYVFNRQSFGTSNPYMNWKTK